MNRGIVSLSLVQELCKIRRVNAYQRVHDELHFIAESQCAHNFYCAWLLLTDMAQEREQKMEKEITFIRLRAHIK